MIDLHIHPESWGVRPVLFSIGSWAVQSYPVFVILALLAGALLYYHNARKEGSLGDHSAYIAAAALVGGIFGAKLPIWIVNLPTIISSPSLEAIYSGRTIIGGLVGGFLSVVWIKRRLGIKSRKGNLFAPSVALGIGIGRIGCFLRGCCYGMPTDLPWGVDFGDGLARHPTQIYEAIFAFGLFLYFQFFFKRPARPGEMFEKLLLYYFIFRFMVEFIRSNELIFFSLSYFQWLSAAAVIFIYRQKLINLFGFKNYVKGNN